MATDEVLSVFFFNDTATTEIYTLSLHDALPIYRRRRGRPPEDAVADAGDQDRRGGRWPALRAPGGVRLRHGAGRARSEEHTSELQSRQYLVCRLLLEKKKHMPNYYYLIVVLLAL